MLLNAWKHTERNRHRDRKKQGIPIVTLYSYLSILVGKISTVFLQILEYLLTDHQNRVDIFGFQS